MSDTPPSFVEQCGDYLYSAWQEIQRQIEEGIFSPPFHLEHRAASLIRDCLTSKIKSYHYVLPTQLLAKATNPEIDSRSLQAAYNSSGAFDARTIAHQVIVPFDRQNSSVLGGSSEPYVNNPLRVPAVTHEYRQQQKNKADWDKLVEVLEVVESSQDSDVATQFFTQMLYEIYQLLAHVKIVYSTPSRISLSQTQDLIERYLDNPSGGERLETVCTALFQTIGKFTGIFEHVKRARVNAADIYSGMLADIECWHHGQIVLIVEVKDRNLTLTQFDSKIETARAHRITEILFITQGIASQDKHELDQRTQHEFTSGQNVYITTFDEFARGIFILLGESGRFQFIRAIGDELDRTLAPIDDRKKWASLLKEA